MKQMDFERNTIISTIDVWYEWCKRYESNQYAETKSNKYYRGYPRYDIEWIGINYINNMVILGGNSFDVHFQAQQNQSSIIMIMIYT